MDRVQPPAPVVEERRAPESPRRWGWAWLVGLGVVVVALVVVVLAVRRSSEPATMSPDEVDTAVKAAVDEGIEEARAEPPDSAGRCPASG